MVGACAGAGTLQRRGQGPGRSAPDSCECPRNCRRLARCGPAARQWARCVKESLRESERESERLEESLRESLRESLIESLRESLKFLTVFSLYFSFWLRFCGLVLVSASWFVFGGFFCTFRFGSVSAVWCLYLLRGSLFVAFLPVLCALAGSVPFRACTCFVARFCRLPACSWWVGSFSCRVLLASAFVARFWLSCLPLLGGVAVSVPLRVPASWLGFAACLPVAWRFGPCEKESE